MESCKSRGDMNAVSSSSELGGQRTKWKTSTNLDTSELDHVRVTTKLKRTEGADIDQKGNDKGKAMGNPW